MRRGLPTSQVWSCPFQASPNQLTSQSRTFQLLSRLVTPSRARTSLTTQSRPIHSLAHHPPRLDLPPRPSSTRFDYTSPAISTPTIRVLPSPHQPADYTCPGVPTLTTHSSSHLIRHTIPNPHKSFPALPAPTCQPGLNHVEPIPMTTRNHPLHFSRRANSSLVPPTCQVVPFPSKSA